MELQMPRLTTTIDWVKRIALRTLTIVLDHRDGLLLTALIIGLGVLAGMD
ncbi:hypothetical protein ABMA08_07605 [Pseudomonas yamanorum]